MWTAETTARLAPSAATSHGAALDGSVSDSPADDASANDKSELQHVPCVWNYPFSSRADGTKVTSQREAPDDVLRHQGGIPPSAVVLQR